MAEDNKVAARRLAWLAQANEPHRRDRLYDDMVRFNVETAHDYDGRNGYDVRRFNAGGDDYSGQSAPHVGKDIRAGLHRLGWTEVPTESGTTMVHPDGLVQLRFEPHAKRSERQYFEPASSKEAHRG